MSAAAVAPRAPKSRSLIARLLTLLLLAPIRFYKALISPLLPPMCRFHPSCSVYAMGAIGVHGPFKGLWLAVRRITRCHPFNAGGLDPVPAKDGRTAEEVLRESFPFIAERLAAPPPPYLAAVLPPVQDTDDTASSSKPSPRD